MPTIRIISDKIRGPKVKGLTLGGNTLTYNEAINYDSVNLYNGYESIYSDLAPKVKIKTD